MWPNHCAALTSNLVKIVFIFKLFEDAEIKMRRAIVYFFFIILKNNVQFIIINWFY